MTKEQTEPLLDHVYRPSNPRSFAV